MNVKSLLITLFVILVSCNEKVPVSQKIDTFNGQIENDFITKTGFREDYKIWWKDNDEILVNNLMYVATVQSEDRTTAIFHPKGDAAEGISFEALYPTAIGTRILPDTLFYNSGSSYLPMYANSIDNNLVFKNLCSILSIIVSPNKVVKAIIVKADGKPLNGPFIIENYTLTMTNTSGFSDEETKIYLDCGDGVTGREFLIPIPPASYSDLLVSIIKNDGTEESMIVSPDSQILLSRNNIYQNTFISTSSFRVYEESVTNLL